jgi:hypothetical protein
MFMTREPHFAQQPMVVGETTLLSTSDLDFDFEPGVRATVGVRPCGGRAWEFSYFGLWQGDASAIVEGDLLTFPGDAGGNVFPWMDWVRVDYSSWLHSFELNSSCCNGCCDQGDSGKGGDKGKGGEGSCGDGRCRSFEWIAGFRYINLGEELHIAAQGAEPGEQGTYNIRTANHLYGGQLGARLRRSQGLFGWEATGKAGIFGNDAQQTQSVEDYLYTIRPLVSNGGGQVAFVGEINISALCRLTDVWNLRAGYNAMWIEGLALAPDQLDFNFATAPSGNQLHNGGGMFLHGANVGLEARW